MDVSERVSDVGADGAQKSPGEVINGRGVGVRLEEEIVVENFWLISIFAGGHNSEQRGAIRDNTCGLVQYPHVPMLCSGVEPWNGMEWNGMNGMESRWMELYAYSAFFSESLILKCRRPFPLRNARRLCVFICSSLFRWTHSTMALKSVPITLPGPANGPISIRVQKTKVINSNVQKDLSMIKSLLD